MKKKDSTRQLKLNRETLRDLKTQDLDRVAGGRHVQISPKASVYIPPTGCLEGGSCIPDECLGA